MQTKTLGIVLIVVGALMLIYGGFSYVTTEKVVDIGPIQIDKQKHHPVRWSPIFGVIMVVAGVVVLGVAATKK